jgi:hypothetical protein
MNKDEILNAIRRYSKSNDGKAPGSQRLSSEIGLRKADWYPKYWLRWGDAIREAGCSPNDWNLAYDETFLIEKYIHLTRELKRFPIEGDLIVKRKNDKHFPNRATFSRLGNKSDRAVKIANYCRTNKGYEDVLEIVEAVLEDQIEAVDSPINSNTCGFVYLIRHGTRREYKIGRTNNPSRREGEIGIELPHSIKPIHVIKTDDPSGVEAYWHRRFAEKRMKNEWFELSATDVQAFKRWKRIF